MLQSQKIYIIGNKLHGKVRIKNKELYLDLLILHTSKYYRRHGTVRTCDKTLVATNIKGRLFVYGRPSGSAGSTFCFPYNSVTVRRILFKFGRFRQ